LLENRVVERLATIPRSVNNRSRITNDPRRLPVSGRTALGRRIADFADGYAAALGGWPGLSEVMCANVTALVVQKRADALRDGNVDPLAVVRLGGAANRAERALQLDRPRESESLSFEEHHVAAAVWLGNEWGREERSRNRQFNVAPKTVAKCVRGAFL
jgi:hypothetical protein